MIPEIETKSIEEIKTFQEIKLKEMLQYISTNSSFYKRLFKEHQIAISDIESLEDLTKIPTTTKEDLQKFNDDFICVSKDKIIDYSTTSGSLGDPVTFALTDTDLNRLAYNEAISFASAGVHKEDIIQLMTTMDRRFMAGLAYFLGARQLGAGIVRVGAGAPELQWDSILKFKPSFLIAVPSQLIKLMEFAKANQIQFESIGIKGIICIGEPIRNQDFSLNTLGETITKEWNIGLFSTYASTEMSTAFTECEAKQGGHHHPELIIVEILDEQKRPVKTGDIGELTITTLGMEAMPLLRFQTGDMVCAHHSTCSCGRNTLRLGPVMGRKQQMIKYKGTTLYPPAISNILSAFKAIDTYIIEISSTNVNTDDLLIKIATNSSSEQLIKELQEKFSAKLRVRPTIEVHSKEDIQQLQLSGESRKPKLVIDKRQFTF